MTIGGVIYSAGNKQISCVMIPSTTPTNCENGGDSLSYLQQLHTSVSSGSIPPKFSSLDCSKIAPRNSNHGSSRCLDNLFWSLSSISWLYISLLGIASSSLYAAFLANTSLTNISLTNIGGWSYWWYWSPRWLSGQSPSRERTGEWNLQMYLKPA